MSSYRFNYTPPRWADADLSKGMTRMVADLHARAVKNAPYLTGALRNSARFQSVGKLAYEVTFGNARVDYAALRERENRKNPNTRFYLRRAGNAVRKRVHVYFQDWGSE